MGVDETINRLVGTGVMDEVIVVGIDNTADRIAEYTPCCDPQYGGGKLIQYESFIINTVKPFIDQSYRSLTARQNTAIVGSSLGGLASFYIARRNPTVFSKSAGMSSSFWWSNQDMVKTVVAASGKVAGQFYIDAGTTAMRDAMVADGYIQGVDLYYYVARGASHNETSSGRVWNGEPGKRRARERVFVGSILSGCWGGKPSLASGASGHATDVAPFLVTLAPSRKG